MREVAARAGVAIKTVSRVLNGEDSVAPALAARVREAADALGYRRNLTASALRRADGRSSTVGLVLQDVANPFSAVLHRAVEDVARARGCLVLTGSVDEDPSREEELVNALLDRQVDGLVIVPAGSDHAYLAPAQRGGTPCVFLDRRPGGLAADSVAADNHGGTRAAVEHLLRAGHRRIAYLGDDIAIGTARERFAGYHDGLRAAGLPVRPELVHHGLGAPGETAAVLAALLARARPPTAVLAGQNLLTMAAVAALRAAGRQREVALVGFDDFALADALDPAVTVVAQDATRMGRLAAELLFARIDGTDAPVSDTRVPTTLVVRGSGEITAPGERAAVGGGSRRAR